MTIMKRSIVCVFVLSLSLLILTVSSHAATNLIENASFETLGAEGEVPHGWIHFAGEFGDHLWVEESDAADGKHVLVIHTRGERNAGLRSEPASASPGQVFKATVKVLTTADNRPALFLDYWDANKQRIIHQSLNPSGSGQWETLEATLEAPAGTEWVSIILYSNAGQSAGRVVWDDATLVEVSN